MIAMPAGTQALDRAAVGRSQRIYPVSPLLRLQGGEIPAAIGVYLQHACEIARIDPMKSDSHAPCSATPFSRCLPC